MLHARDSPGCCPMPLFSCHPDFNLHRFTVINRNCKFDGISEFHES